MKKVLSLVLVIAMVLSSMSFAFAAKFDDVTGNYEKAISTLAGLGIVTGYEDGSFRPEKVVTRAEMAKLMVEILGYGDLVAGAKSNFTDTQGHWADQWIAIAAGRNIVIGTGDGKFAPDRTVSYDEVLTMVVRGLGYTDNSNEIKSMTWPTNFKVKAAELGVTEGVKMTTTGADRGGVAQALYNALEATLVSVDNEGNVRVLQDNRQKDLPLITRIATVVGTEDSPLRIEPRHVDKDSKDYAGDIVDLAKYMYEEVEAYASKANKKTIVYVSESFSKTVEGTFVANHDGNATNVVTANGYVDVDLADESTKTLRVNTTGSNIEVFYNGEQVSMSEFELENGKANKIIGLDGTEVAEVKVVTSGSKGDIVDAIVVKNPTYGQMMVAGYKAGALKLGRIQLPQTGSKVDLDKVTVTGKVDDIKDIKADDVVIAYAAGGADNKEIPSALKLVVVRESVNGTITKVNKNTAGATTAIYIDGVKYTKSEIDGQIDNFDVGFEGDFFLDDSGRLFASDATEIALAKDYAVVIKAEAGYKANNSTTGTTVADAKITLINASGEVVTYKVDKDAEYQGTTTGDVLTNLLAFNGTIGSKSLIKYKLDGDVIDSIDLLMTDVLGTPAHSSSKTSVATNNAKFEVAKDAPIFNVRTGQTDYTKKEHYSVVNIENLPSSIDVKFADFTTSGQYKVIVSTTADRSVVGTFALVTAVNYVMDGNNKVAEIKGYVDGKEVTYLAKSALTLPTVNKGNIYEFGMVGGKVSTVDPNGPVTTILTPTTPSAFTVESASAARVTFKNVDTNVVTSAMDLDTDNLVIYVLKSDNKFDYIEEDAKNIVGFEVVGAYKTAGTGTDINILVVK